MARTLPLVIVCIAFAGASACSSGSGTSLPPPEVVAMQPGGGAVDVSPDVIITATFNQQMNLTTVNDATFVLGDADGMLVAGEVTYDSATFTATLTPDAPLDPDVTYTAGISGGVANIANTPLGSDVSWTFTTAAPP
jgi:hypothetical protein